MSRNHDKSLHKKFRFYNLSKIDKDGATQSSLGRAFLSRGCHREGPPPRFPHASFCNQEYLEQTLTHRPEWPCRNMQERLSFRYPGPRLYRAGVAGNLIKEHTSTSGLSATIKKYIFKLPFGFAKLWVKQIVLLALLSLSFQQLVAVPVELVQNRERMSSKGEPQSCN